ncbi:hypothetical protein BGX38DRAFT_1171928 [Terfezia claveryi]|nr:hypothetical protein BGX38DRAFT_1171928 [Terfezia claveryi]
MLSLIWSINITTFAYIFIGPIIPFYFIFNILRMLFWGGIYITLSPLTSDGTYVLPIRNFTTDVESTTYGIAASFKSYILPVLQVGLGIVSLIIQMFWFLVILCFGNEIDSITSRLCPSPNGVKLDDGFLARLNAALTLGSILTKSYAITRDVVIYLINSPSLRGVADRRREFCGKKFQIPNDTRGVEAENVEMVGVYRQAGAKFSQGIESGYSSTGEDEVCREYCITEGEGSRK